MKMTPEQELQRLKKDFEKQWPRLEKLPEFRQALDRMDLVRLGEIASSEVLGDYRSAEVARRFSMYH
jgi:hypothetical protein